MRTCTKCRTAKSLDQFPPVRRGGPELQTWCRTCFAIANAANYAKNREREKTRLVAQVNAHRKENQERLVGYLSQHPCVDCGEADIVVLEFDHRADKVADISTFANSGRTWERILSEIRKCDVRCANCHRRKTAERVMAAPTKVSKGSTRKPIQLDLASALARRTCRACQRTLRLGAFAVRSRAARTFHWICLDCQRSRSNAWYRQRVGRAVRPMRTRGTASRRERASFVFAYLLTHPCVDCGKPDPVLLDFDHTRDKLANVSDLVAWRAPIAQLVTEMRKCEVRCANCHRRRTAKAGGWYRTVA
jgi:hypothetical protein